MIIGRVIGEIYSTINHPILDHRKLLIVEKLTPQGSAQDDYLVAIDTVGAGVGQTVLVIDEGNSARQVLAAPNAPTRSIIVGIIDAIDVSGDPDMELAEKPRAAGRQAGRPSPGRAPRPDAASADSRES